MVTHKMTRDVSCFSESLPLPFVDHATSATLSYPHFRLGRRPLLLVPCYVYLYIPKDAQAAPCFRSLAGI